MAKRKQKDNFDLGAFQVLHDNVLIKGIDIEERDGIIRPAQYGDKSELGIVLKVGSGRVLESGTILPLSVKEGDKVYFNKYSYTQFNFDGEDYFVVREEDIVGYIR